METIFSSDMIRFEFLVYPRGCSEEKGREGARTEAGDQVRRLFGVQVGIHSTQCGLNSKASFSQLQPAWGASPALEAAGLTDVRYDLNRLLFSSYKERNKPHHCPHNPKHQSEFERTYLPPSFPKSG